MHGKSFENGTYYPAYWLKYFATPTVDLSIKMVGGKVMQ